MSTLKVNNIQNASGTDAISIGSDGSLSYPNIGRRNLIINGAMQVAQRGTSFTGTGYSLDRWYGLSGRTITQDTDVPSDEFLYSLKCVSSGNAPRVFGSVELSSTGTEHPIRSSTDYTLSGWVKGTSGETLTCRVSFANGVGQGDYRSISSLSLETLDGNWQYFTATFNSGSGIVGASDNCLELYFSLPTNDTTFQITGVQLEVGSVATPFEHRSYGEELALCMRYYELLYTMDGCHAGSFGGWAHENKQCVPHYKVRKRAVPTITFYDYSSNISGTPWVTRDFQTAATQDCFKFNARFFGTNEYIYIDGSNGSIIADAEL